MTVVLTAVDIITDVPLAGPKDQHCWAEIVTCVNFPPLHIIPSHTAFPIVVVAVVAVSVPRVIITNFASAGTMTKEAASDEDRLSQVSMLGKRLQATMIT